MSTKCPLSPFSLWLCAPFVMVVTQDRRGGLLHGVTGHQGQLRSGHCCTCTVSCKTCPPLVQVVPATVIPITCSSNLSLESNKFQDLNT